jgi:hypothetical protein
MRLFEIELMNYTNAENNDEEEETTSSTTRLTFSV